MDHLEGLAHAEVATDPALAARLLGAAESLRGRLGAPHSPARRADHQRAVAAARVALGDAAYAATHSEGAALTLEQALASARRDTA